MSSARLLVTGATGFVGTWVLRRWREKRPEVEVWGTSELPEPDGFEAARYVRLDLRDGNAVRDVVRECRPSEVIHLASLIADADLEEFLSVNVVGTEHLYRALAELALPRLRVVQVGSAAMYGRVLENELPITEEQPLRPLTLYAVSKAAQDHLALATALSDGLAVVRARVFNLLGPGQPEQLVPMTFIRQLKSIKEGSSDRVHAGLVTARRDFVDVRDAAAAFELLLRQGEPGRAYNVASGRDVSVEEIISRLMEICEIDAPVEVDDRRLRRVDVPCVRADVSRASAEVGWSASISLDTSLKDMWREALTG